MAIEFDGNDDTINLGSSAEINNIFSGGGSIAFWFLIHTRNNRALHKRGDPEAAGWMCQDLDTPGSSKTFRFYHDFSIDDGDWHCDVNSISLDTWHHMAITYNNDTTAAKPIFYLDGALNETVGSGPTGTASADAGEILFISPVVADTFDGQLEDIRMWDSIISSAQAAVLASGYRGPLGGEVGWWTLEDADGVTAWDGVAVSTGSAIIPDKSINSNVGTPQGGGTYRASRVPRMGIGIHE